MNRLRRWRRIYRTVRIMSLLDLYSWVEVRAWLLPDGGAEIRMEITGLTSQAYKANAFIDNIPVHPSTPKDMT